MRQGLGHVAEERARSGVGLLAVEPDVVREADERVEELTGFVEARAVDERVGQPERAREERALGPLHAAVAVDQRAGAELRTDRVDGAVETLVVAAEEPAARREQDARVEIVGAWMDREAVPRRRPAPALDPLAHRSAFRTPPVEGGKHDPALLDEPDRTIERDPAPDLRLGEVTLVRKLPDPGVLRPPRVAHLARVLVHEPERR